MADSDEERAARDRALDSLGQIIDGLVMQACARHYNADTQEHQLTAKIADRIEEEMTDCTIDGYTIDVAVQDFSDKGATSKESKVGADLYVSVVLRRNADEEPESKGMLVQAKWDRKFFPGRADIRSQLETMLDKSPASYVWVYTPAGAFSMPADHVLEGVTESEITPGQMIASGLKCNEGDYEIGIDTEKDLVPALNEVMEELTVPNGLAVKVEKIISRRSRPLRAQ